MLSDFPPHIQREIRSILSQAARRMLAIARQKAREAGEPLPTELVCTVDDIFDGTLGQVVAYENDESSP